MLCYVCLFAFGVLNLWSFELGFGRWFVSQFVAFCCALETLLRLFCCVLLVFYVVYGFAGLVYLGCDPCVWWRFLLNA